MEDDEGSETVYWNLVSLSGVSLGLFSLLSSRLFCLSFRVLDPQSTFPPTLSFVFSSPQHQPVLTFVVFCFPVLPPLYIIRSAVSYISVAPSHAYGCLSIMVQACYFLYMSLIVSLTTALSAPLHCTAVQQAIRVVIRVGYSFTSLYRNLFPTDRYPFGGRVKSATEKSEALSCEEAGPIARTRRGRPVEAVLHDLCPL